MQTNEIYTQFCDFWSAYRPADKYANRRSCTFSQWLQRSTPARCAMLRTVRHGSVNPDRNPFFWVQDYPEPVPKGLQRHCQRRTHARQRRSRHRALQRQGRHLHPRGHKPL